MSARLILIRHGETDWSSRKRYCGFTDVDLNERGRTQAIELSKRLKGEDVHKVYSSDLKRALRFAGIVFNGMSIESMQELREMRFGVFEGSTYEELMQKHPEVYAKWLNNPFEVDIPEGEEWKGFEERVRSALDKIISLNKGRTVAVVTHAGPIKVIMGREMQPALASFNIMDFDNGGYPNG